MSDLIDRDDTLKIIADTISLYGTGTKVESEILSVVSKIPSAEPYTEEEILTMQELEQAQIQKAFELGREDAQPEIIKCEDCMHNGSFDTDCPIGWNGKEYCSFAER